MTEVPYPGTPIICDLPKGRPQKVHPNGWQTKSTLKGGNTSPPKWWQQKSIRKDGEKTHLNGGKTEKVLSKTPTKVGAMLGTDRHKPPHQEGGAVLQFVLMHGKKTYLNGGENTKPRAKTQQKLGASSGQTDTNLPTRGGAVLQFVP